MKKITEPYNDERIHKVSKVLTASVLTSLAAMLYSSAMDFEYTVFTGPKDSEVRRPLLQNRCAEEVCVNASEWFRCFASLPYDATFRLEALLDCLEFFMGDRYGKFQLVDVYKIELLQLGFGFVNAVGR
jgi:hypothetical protein